MTRIYDIADSYVERFAELNPVAATSLGVPGHDSKMSDYSPAGAEANAALNRRTLSDLQAAEEENDRDRIAREAMVDELRTSLDQFDAGEHLRNLRVPGSPFQSIRMTFDLMPRETEEHWSNIASRLSLVPDALTRFRDGLLEGQRQGKASSKRQAIGCAKQAEVWSSAGNDGPSFFHALLDAFDGSGVTSGALERDLRSGVDSAAKAYADMGAFLMGKYLANADERDPVGRRYRKRKGRNHLTAAI